MGLEVKNKCTFNTGVVLYSSFSKLYIFTTSVQSIRTWIKGTLELGVHSMVSDPRVHAWCGAKGQNLVQL